MSGAFGGMDYEGDGAAHDGAPFWVRCGAYAERGLGRDGKGCGMRAGHEGNHSDGEAWYDSVSPRPAPFSVDAHLKGLIERYREAKGRALATGKYKYVEDTFASADDVVAYLESGGGTNK